MMRCMYQRFNATFTAFLLVTTGSSYAADIQTDLVIYGDGSGGVTAAVQGARMGKATVLVSDHNGHLGGLTSSGLGWTDIGNRAILGGLSREFYHRIYQHYRDESAWVHQPQSQFPKRGQGAESFDPLTQLASVFEPKVAEQIFKTMAYEAGVKIIRGRIDQSNGVTRQGTTITHLHLEGGTTIAGSMFIDASYEGDLMAAAGVSFRTGRESNQQFGETHNGYTGTRHGNQIEVRIDPYVIPGDVDSGLIRGITNADIDASETIKGQGDNRFQAYCYRLCLTDVPENRIAITKPVGYEEGDFEIVLRAAEAGKKARYFKTSPIPNRKTDSNNASGISMDYIGMNYGIDPNGNPWNWATLSHAERDKLAAKHAHWQLGLIWTIQNHPRVPQAVRNAWSRWGLAKDEFADNGGIPYNLYVREARRMASPFVMTEAHCRNEKPIDDPIAMGAYTMDSHNVQRLVHDGVIRNEGDIQKPLRDKGPYPISYRAIIPARNECTNLLVPWSLSATHIAFGSIRMEPVFMCLGQAAATAAVQAIDCKTAVQDVPYTVLQKQLLDDGARLEIPTNHAVKKAIQKKATVNEVPDKASPTKKSVNRKLVPPRFAEGLIIGRAQYTFVDTQKKRRLTLDTYRPKNVAANTKLPILVIYFGGGWMNGRPGHMTPLAQAIAQRGYVTVVPNYRLSREAPFPAALHDCKAAIRWARSHAKSLKGDPDKIAVTGGSAGGHLAGLVAATNGLDEFEGQESNISSEVQALVVMCGSMDLLSESTQKNIQLSKQRGQVHPIIQFLGGTPSERRETYIQASPNTHLSESMPPSLFIDGELDNPRARYIETWKKMDDFDIEHEFVLMKDAPHPFWNYEQWFDATVDAFDTFLSKSFKQSAE